MAHCAVVESVGWENKSALFDDNERHAGEDGDTEKNGKKTLLFRFGIYRHARQAPLPRQRLSRESLLIRGEGYGTRDVSIYYLILPVIRHAITDGCYATRLRWRRYRHWLALVTGVGRPTY